MGLSGADGAPAERLQPKKTQFTEGLIQKVTSQERNGQQKWLK